MLTKNLKQNHSSMNSWKAFRPVKSLEIRFCHLIDLCGSDCVWCDGHVVNELIHQCQYLNYDWWDCHDPVNYSQGHCVPVHASDGKKQTPWWLGKGINSAFAHVQNYCVVLSIEWEHQTVVCSYRHWNSKLDYKQSQNYTTPLQTVLLSDTFENDQNAYDANDYEIDSRKIVSDCGSKDECVINSCDGSKLIPFVLDRLIDRCI